MTDDDPSTDDRIVTALRERDRIVLTASDLADVVGVHRTTVLDHLHDLEAVGEVASIEVGARAVGWYLPTDLAKLGEPLLIPTYHELVRRPVDQRGRVTIGAEYAKKTVTFAILDPFTIRQVEPADWTYDTPLKWQRAVEVMDDKADDRGRVDVGKDRADEEISLAVLEVAG